MDKLIRILVIEDEVGVQMTLEDRLKIEGYDVTIKGDGIDGENEALTNEYQLILLDIMLSNRDGFAICENIRAAGISVPILMLTARNTDLDTVIGLRQGADDYMSKPFNMTVLLARIEALLRRTALSSEIVPSMTSSITFGEFELNKDTGELYKGGETIPLNSLEYRLIVYFLTNDNTIISRDTLLDNVWGYESETTSRTVDVHIAKLRSKLGESELPLHIQTIWGRGYKFIINP